MVSSRYTAEDKDESMLSASRKKEIVLLELKPSQMNEVNSFIQMEALEDTSYFIIPYSESEHQIEMRKEAIEYLSIYHQRKLIGFIILSLEEKGRVEFRRIVIAEKGQGFGQASMKLMERYCEHNLQAQSIWLDVFSSNLRGVHIYQKCGYQLFEEGEFKGRRLLMMEKKLT